MSHYRDLADGWATNRGGGPTPKTEADFKAHLVTLAVDGVKAWGGALNINTVRTWKYRTTAAAFANNMWGSPAGSRFGVRDSAMARIVQHSLPNGDLVGATAGRDVYLEVISDADFDDLLSKSVNGYTSLAEGAGAQYSGRVVRIIWWDGAKAMSRDPSVNSVPVPYVIP